MIKVGFDAGHALTTPGKETPDHEKEWSFNNKIARAFANELALYEGVASKRFDDPTGKRDVPLKERTDGANSWGADYYISFHHNGLGGKWGKHGGVETHVYEKTKNPQSIALANAIHPAVVKSYGLHDRGIKKTNLHITRETTCAAVLIEGGFMDSDTDINALRNDTTLLNVGKAIAQAFANFVGLKKFGEVKGVSTIKEETILTQEILNETGRFAARELIKKGVKEGLFTSKHENVEKYEDKELISYSFAYINRKFH